MKTEIDRELAKHVTNALHDTKKRNYIFVHGVEESALLIDKKPLGQDKLKSAQKSAKNTSKFYKGVCFSEDKAGVKTLVFLVARVDEGLERKIRQAIKEIAGLTCPVEVRAASDGELADVHDTTPDAVRLPKQATQEQKDIANKAMVKRMLKVVGGKMDYLQRYEPARAAELLQKIGPLLAKAEELASPTLPENQRQCKKALEILLKLKTHVPQPTDTNKRPGPAFSAEYWVLARQASMHLKQMQEVAPRAAQDGRTLADEATRLGRMMQFADANKKLTELLATTGPLLSQATSTAGVFALLQKQQNPAFAVTELGAFEADIETASNAPLTEAAKGLAGIEERMRQALTERQRFLESAQSTRASIDKAKPSLDPQATQTVESVYQAAFDKAEHVNFNTGYDRMTQVEARIQAFLRKTEMKEQIGQVQGTEETRRVKFEIAMQHLRRSLGLITQAKSPRAAQFRVLLDKLADLAKTHLDQAESKLDLT